MSAAFDVVPALILIPGLLNDAELWRDQITGLRDEAECRVADITKGGDLETLASRVLENAPERFALAGFSLGGYVAVEMARQAPERIQRLALLDTAIVADSSERARNRRLLEEAASGPGRFHGFGNQLLRSYLAAGNLRDEAIVSRVRGMTERLGLEIFVRQSRIPRKDGSAVLAGLTCPVLILCGDEDAITPLSGHVAMAAVAPQARLVVVPGSGHMTPIEQPEAVTRALREWLRRPAT